MSSGSPEPEAGSDAGTTLEPLTPVYDAAEHEVYLRYLRQALDGQDSIHNIALMGAYGVGKSSILQELTRELKGRAVTLSLATLGEAPTAGSGIAGENPAATTVTNRIQKEIVKQLLYRERPEHVPSSRFRRRTVFNWRQAILNSALASAVLMVVLYLTHAADRLADLIGHNLLERGSAYVILLVLSLVILTALQRAFHDQARIQQFVAGPASVTLDSTSGSYFDEWLDEIVYFFEATKVDVLIFEDIDRFDDPHIFETLRELNTILNNSKQLNGRNVRFIYAIKDSIFDQLGLSTAGKPMVPDAAEAEVRRANRTKFFDIVIPVVPFITHRNARDLMSRQVEEWQLPISRDLVDLVAGHVADMRLITNIRNEFVVYREKLLGEGGIPGLSDDQLFAMMLYKNVHLSDFELIRTGDSKLDTLYWDSRRLVIENMQRLNDQVRDLSGVIDDHDPLASRAEELGEALEAYINRVVKQHRSFGVNTVNTRRNGRDVPSQELRTPAFWQSFLQEGWQLDVQTYPYANETYHFSAGNIGNGLGEDLSLDRWKTRDIEVARRRLASVKKDRSLLARATMQELWDRPDFTLRTEKSERSFAEVVKEKLGSQLAIDLVANGYIDQNFTLYVSQYYGVHVSSQAMNFILKNAQPNVMDPYFHLDSPTDVEAVLRERGHSILSDRSSYNIAILDHLIEHPTSEADPDDIIHRLPVWGLDEQVFLHAYVGNGRNAAEVIRRLSDFWLGTLRLVANELDVDEQQRTVLFNAAMLGADSAQAGFPDASVRSYIERNYRKLAALTDARETSAPAHLVNLLYVHEVRLPTISPLSDPIREDVIKLRLYVFSKENLVDAAGGEDNLSLDRLEAANKAVYNYALDNLQTYVDIVTQETTARCTIDTPDRFLPILEDVAKHDPSVLPVVIEHASSGCRVVRLADVSNVTWPDLARTRHFPLTFANVQAYVTEYGTDENLAVGLLADPRISEVPADPRDETERLAVQILAAGDYLVDPAVRVRIVHSLGPIGPIEVTRLNWERGKLAGLLVEAGIIDDTAAVYGAVLGTDWGTKEFLISKSAHFAEYVTPELLSTKDLELLLSSKVIGDAVKRSMVRQIKRFTGPVNGRTLQAAATYALRMHVPLDAETLLLFAEAKVAATTIVPLLQSVLSRIPLETLRAVLQEMGGQYAILVGPTRRSAKLPNDPANRALAAHLKVVGDVSTFGLTPDEKHIKVNMKHQ